MLKTRFIITISALALVVILFKLPRVVVDNDSTSDLENSEGNSSGEGVSHASATDNTALLEKAKELKDSLALEDNPDKRSNFALTLSAMYKDVLQYDSAAYYKELVVKDFPNEESWYNAGAAYYEAYSFAVDADRIKFLSDKALEYLNKVLEISPDRIDAKIKVAMIAVSTESPMKGIMMLREVLEQEPENEEALLSMGTLSMQSGQYERGVERFKKLVSVNPSHVQGTFFLAVCQKELGNVALARQYFEKVKSLDNNPEVIATVDDYLKELNN